MSEQNLFEKLMADFQTFPLEDVRQLLADELSKAPEEMDTKLVELCVEAIENAEKGQKLAAALKSDSLRMTSSDIRKLLAEELAKKPEEMDTKLVDLCVEAIEDAEKGRKLAAALKSDSLRMTSSDVRKLLAEELAKKPEEMDTKLVDLCAEALNCEHPETPDDGEDKGNKNVFLLVALIAALVAAFLPSIASRLNIKAEENVVALGANGDFVVGVGKSDTETQEDLKEKSPLLCALREAGIEDPVLPSCLLDSRLKFTVQKTADEGDYSVVSIEFTDPVRSKSGFAKIKSFNRPLSENETVCVNNYFVNAHQTRLEELDAFSFSGEDRTYTCYISGNAVYTIFLADTV